MTGGSDEDIESCEWPDVCLVQSSLIMTSHMMTAGVAPALPIPPPAALSAQGEPNLAVALQRTEPAVKLTYSEQSVLSRTLC